MTRGIIKLFCPMCNSIIMLNGESKDTFQHSTFGILCGKACFEKASMKYARLILGKDDLK